MIAELGAFSLILALVFSLAQAGLSVAGRITRAQAFRRAGEGASLAAFLAVAAAFLALMAAFVGSDFSIAYVANNSHTDKPLIYKIAGVWGGHEGSLLLWCLALTGYGAAIALFGERLPRDLKSLIVATQGVLGVLFIGFAVFASNAFLRLPTPPVEGRSRNPLLQDPALALHPPFLYAGYVGRSVPFSLAVAALVEGRIDAAWARWVRPWTLAAWSFLTVGITLGAFWAYYELGWGGWWAWDPVENASFMPWLASAALLHSAIVTEKRGALPGWTVFLALLAFSFSMLGAFLVRSGILTSVHAFAVDPTRGVILVGIMLLAAGAGFALFAWRAPRLAPGGVFAPISREASLVLNNLFLAIAAAVVFVGTLFPLLFEALHKTISIGPPYFNLTFAPLMAGALLVLPAGPLLAWKRADLKGVWQRLAVAALLAVGAAVLTLVLHAPLAAFAAIGVGLGVWVAAGALVEAAQRVRLFKAPLAESLRRIGGLPRESWGMTLAHLGLGLFVMGAAYETAYRVEASEVLAPGGSLRLGAYVLTLESVVGVAGPNYEAERARIAVTRANGAPVCKAEPERRYYPANRQQTSEVGLCFKGLSDLYVVAGDARPLPGGGEGRLVRAYWNPWVRLIFLGPLLMAIGGALSLSDRRLRLAAGKRVQPAAAEARA